MPASSARWMMRMESSWSALPQAPNIMLPRQSGETWTPVRPSGRWSMSGLRDVAAEVLKRDGVGLGPAAPAGFQAVEGGHLVGGELEVEDVDVLSDPLRLDGLGDDRAAVLDAPAEHDLGGALFV